MFYVASRGAGQKHRLFVWNQRNPGTELMGSKLRYLGVLLTPVFIANSKGGADFLTGALHAKERRVHVIPNGVELADPMENRAEWRSRLGFDEKTLLACMVANLSSYKDHETLLRAWRLAVDRIPGNHVSLFLAGRFDDSYDRLAVLAKDRRSPIRFAFWDRSTILLVY